MVNSQPDVPAAVDDSCAAAGAADTASDATTHTTIPSHAARIVPSMPCVVLAIPRPSRIGHARAPGETGSFSDGPSTHRYSAPRDIGFLPPDYPIRFESFSSSVVSGSFAMVTFFHCSSSSSFAACSKNSGAAHACTSKSFLM
jgi:hypothetical protein